MGKTKIKNTFRFAFSVVQTNVADTLTTLAHIVIVVAYSLATVKQY